MRFYIIIIKSIFRLNQNFKEVNNMVDNDQILEQVLQLGQALNTFQLQTTASFNELRAEIKENKREIQKSREIENAHWEENKRLWAENTKRWEENNKRWEENNKRWEENDKRWEENDKRWEENDKRWERNEKCWEKYEKDRKNDHNELLDILTQFDLTISKKLGDPNVGKMQKIIDISKIKR